MERGGAKSCVLCVERKALEWGLCRQAENFAANPPTTQININTATAEIFFVGGGARRSFLADTARAQTANEQREKEEQKTSVVNKKYKLRKKKPRNSTIIHNNINHRINFVLRIIT